MRTLIEWNMKFDLSNEYGMNKDEIQEKVFDFSLRFHCFSTFLIIQLIGHVAAISSHKSKN